jgi:hypothetical protein
VAVLALGFDEVEFGDDAEALAGEGDGAGVEDFGFGWFRRRGRHPEGADSGSGREGGCAGVDALVLGGAFEGVGAFAEDAFDPHRRRRGAGSRRTR